MRAACLSLPPDGRAVPSAVGQEVYLHLNWRLIRHAVVVVRRALGVEKKRGALRAFVGKTRKRVRASGRVV